MEIEGEKPKNKGDNDESANIGEKQNVDTEMQFSKQQIMNDVNPMRLYLIIRLILKEKEWKHIKETIANEKMSNNEKAFHISDVQKKKISAAFPITSQIENIANQNKQDDFKKILTFWLASKGVPKAVIRFFAKIGLTTTIHHRKLYPEQKIISWYQQEFAPYLSAIKKGLFIMMFDNNYFRITTPSVGAESNQFSRMKEVLPEIFSKYNFKTATMLIIFPDLAFCETSAFRKDGIDFTGDSLTSTTSGQSSAFEIFVNQLVSELDKDNPDMAFFKRFDIGKRNHRVLTLESAMCGDDSKNDILKIIQHGYDEIKKLFGIDVSKTNFQFGCDAKGYIILQGLSEKSQVFQKFVFGDFHFEKNMMTGFLDLFYDHGVSECGKALKIDKKFKNCCDYEIKKVRKIIHTICFAYNDYLRKNFSKKEGKTSSSVLFQNSASSISNSIPKNADIEKNLPKKLNISELLDYYWDFFKQKKQLFLRITSKQKFDYKLKWKINYLKKSREDLLSEIKKRGLLFDQGKTEFPDLAAVLIKNDFDNLKEPLLFCVENLDGETKESLQIMCCLIGMKFCDNISEMKQGIIKNKFKLIIDLEEHYALSLFVIYCFASLCLAFHAAIRTSNWDLRLYVMKKAAYLFSKAKKTHYLKMTDKHLKDLKNNFDAREYSLFRELWCISAKTRNTYIGEDEEVEFVNKDIKKIDHPSVNNVKWTSRNQTFSEFLDKSLVTFSEVVDAENNRKKADDSLKKNIVSIMEIPKRCLLLPFNELFSFDRF